MQYSRCILCAFICTNSISSRVEYTAEEGVWGTLIVSYHRVTVEFIDWTLYVYPKGTLPCCKVSSKSRGIKKGLSIERSAAVITQR